MKILILVWYFCLPIDTKTNEQRLFELTNEILKDERQKDKSCLYSHRSMERVLIFPQMYQYTYMYYKCYTAKKIKIVTVSLLFLEIYKLSLVSTFAQHSILSNIQLFYYTFSYSLLCSLLTALISCTLYFLRTDA